MIGYNRLAQLGKSFESDMAALDHPLQAAPGAAGSVAVEVKQLATAQELISGPFGDPDQVSLGSGTLTIEVGTVDPESGAFVPGSDPLSIPIASGSLNDIADSINASSSGIRASVVEENGGFSLHLAGDTGAASAFKITGMAELDYDPAKPDLSYLATVQNATDTLYSLDGEDFTFGSNTDVPVAMGTRVDFSGLGSLSVAKSPLPDAAKSLMDAFNGIQKSIASMAGKDGKLEKDVNLAAGLFKSLGDAATASYSDAGSFTQLADIGMTLQPDGTFVVDQKALDAAVAKDPTGVEALINQVSAALSDAMKPYTGSNGSLNSQVSLLSALMMHNGPSLIDYLTGNGASQQGGLASYLGGEQSTDTSGGQKDLLSYLDGSSA
ncbi:flagellar capping protein [Paramagnetospirillum kuznetsovii]|uniref:Flagellar capping protein n=1 Tax=Paramagnetospirillum kuznetsovii TaxID=2053833 RepID=A0A364P145_9PROT|nr:flagellar capping protein [Paramagnetospirillum kuznetsovii]